MAQNTTTDDMKRDANAAVDEAARDLKGGADRIAEDVRRMARDLSQNSGADRLADRGAALASEALDAGRD